MVTLFDVTIRQGLEKHDDGFFLVFIQMKVSELSRGQIVTAGGLMRPGQSSFQPLVVSHEISATQPQPGTMEKAKPCSLTIAVTKLSPSPSPGVPRLLSDR